MVHLGFVTGFVRPYAGTRRDGQLFAVQHTSLILACKPSDVLSLGLYARTQVRVCKQAFFYVKPLWNPYMSHTNPPGMHARTQVRAYEPSDVLSLGLHAGITDAACKRLKISIRFEDSDLVTSSDSGLWLVRPLLQPKGNRQKHERWRNPRRPMWTWSTSGGSHEWGISLSLES